MFGFIIGTACLVGLVKLARGGCGSGYGYGSCGGGGGWQGRHGRWGRGRSGGGGWGDGFMLRGISSRLDATPGQEKVLAEALKNIRASFEKIRDEKDQARKDVATAFKGE